MSKVLQNVAGVEPHFSGQSHGLRVGHVVNSHQVIGDQLHFCTRAKRAHVWGSVRESLQDRQGLLVELFGAAGKNGPGSCLELLNGANDGAVYCGNADRLQCFGASHFVC